MKKILLIGKLDQIVQNLNECLVGKFNVQLCSESVELVRGMMKISKPDMVIICSIDANDIQTDIFQLLSSNAYSYIPVLVVGTREGCHKFREYYEKSQFEYMIRPISKETLLKKCSERLNMVDSASDSSELQMNDNSTEEQARKRILIVDDSALALRNAKAMLDKKYNVMVATSGKQAMTVLQKKRPDLILLDYEMPGWDGKTTLENIRQEKEFEDIPVIFLTGVADKEHITAVLRLNPAGYFLKPLEKEKLLEAIDKIFGEG
ncbi:MAG: response regulator [Lachnospiraceae bacterium]|nr:response regulator [Lachnospiraceae bacterium]MBP3505249.1 response regulator [Lachnospiraceae bacterium]